MNTTTVGPPAKTSSEVTVVPVTASVKAKAGASKPKGMSVVGVRAIQREVVRQYRPHDVRNTPRPRSR